MRDLDRAQRPLGNDLPMERFIAWQTRRDTSQASPPELTAELQNLAGEAYNIVKRIDVITPRTKWGYQVVSAYRAAHETARIGLEAVHDHRTLGTQSQSRAAEQRVMSALDALREARTLRHTYEHQIATR